jgi:tetratricopeptide (TPR) repeat protein
MMVTSDGDTAIVPPSSPPDPPERVGPYRILRVIGEGGMGVVYEAEQLEPVRRSVALKMMKVGMDTRDVVARFEVERQALAMMDHPGIAKVLDAGATETGRPYFVMEYVKGVPIGEYCDARQLSTRERLELFIPVCQAVQHAHQKGVIHRDLKPSNVLTTEQHGEPATKVIDFGIAKAVSQRLTDLTLVTAYGVALGTPAYMSPEQAEMTGMDVDTRTDIYSLGVLLYELLVGALPVDPFEVGLPAFIAQLVRRDTGTTVPSARLSGVRRADHIAGLRSTSPSGLRKELKGDLDWIVLRAMDKDRNRRYDTANGLAMDLRRYLRNEPVVARPPTAGYRFRKFVRRNKAGAVAAAGIALALTGGAVAATVGMVRASRAEAVAEQEAATATQTAEFLVDLFQINNPFVARGRELTAREVLDSGAARLRTDLADAPAVQARIMKTIGTVYAELGLYEEAAPLFDEALARYVELYGRDHVEVAQTAREMAHFLILKSDFARADTLNRLALATFTREYGETDERTVDVFNNLVFGALREGADVSEYREHMEALLPRARVALGDSSTMYALTMDHLCWIYLRLDEGEAADTTCDETLALRRAIYGGDHPQIGYTLKRVAAARRMVGNYEGSLAALEEAVAMDRRLYGTDFHPEVAYGLMGIGSTYDAMGRYEEALPYVRQAVAIRAELLGNDNSERAASLTQLGTLLTDLGRLEEADSVLSEALAMHRRAMGTSHASLILPMNNLASVRLRLDDPAGAEELFRNALDIARAQSSSGIDGEILQTNLARVLTVRGRLAEACARADSARTALAAAVGADHWRTAIAMTVEGRCLTRARGAPDTEAERYLTEGWELLQASRPVGESYRQDALQYLVEYHRRAGRTAEEQQYESLLAREIAPDG